MRLRFTEAPPAARENKPRWSDVPTAAVAALERALGASVAEAEIAWGGYSPSASFHLTLADGRHAFVKGTHPGQTREGRLSLAQEIESYRALPVLKGLAPDYLGTIEVDAWTFLLLEAIEGAQKALPWSPAKLERLAQSLAVFYERARDLAMTWQRPNAYRSLAIDLSDLDTGWIALARSTDAQKGFLSLFADRAAARRWFDRSLPRLVELQSAAGELLQPAPERATSLIHLDLRSDNLLFRADGAPVLLDWSYVTTGPVVLDTVFFAPSVEGEGGLAASETVALFERALGLRFPKRDQQIALAFAAGYFADKAYLPPPPGLPRLRWIQRLQLAVCLGWAVELIGLPEAPAMIGQDAP
ncbi:phosphotransferase [Hypericibacter sp.]|uniref:phosphotransferase n=1 Tax=Hypericibacter sp. TaxID=2705401 RepID=UPI003D6CBE19